MPIAQNYALLHAQWIDGFADVIPLARPTTRIGRRPENDIVIDHPAISGAHLEISFAQGAAQVRDLGSRNGSSLDGQALAPDQFASMRPDSMIVIAAVLQLRLELIEVGDASVKVVTPVALRFQASPGLEIRGQDGSLQRIVLGDRTVQLGRTPDNDIVIPEAVVSGHHAEIVPQPVGGHAIVDLNSRNGLTVEGQRIQQLRLQPDVIITIAGQIQMRYLPVMGFVTAGGAEGAKAAEEGAGAPSAAHVFTAGDLKVIRIGRAADNELQLDDPAVSRYHAVVERVGARYRIRDLRSQNGTFVNGRRVEREQFIAEGDLLHVGGAELALAGSGLTRSDPGNGLRLDVIGLHKEVSRRKNLLQDISLSIYPREFVALVGTSGAGKSTLMDAINGFRPATHGRVLVNGVDLYRHFDVYRGEIGYVPQDDIMHRDLTVYEALDYAARLRMPADTSRAERQTRVAQVLQDLDLEQRKALPIQKLSGGQRKRVSIGIELLTRPRLFFLDEATSGLDPGTELELMQLLRQLTEDRNEGRTILLITHATKNVMLCDNVIFLTKGGYLAFYGPPDKALEHFEQYRTVKARRLKPDFEFDDIYGLLDPDRALAETASDKEKLALAATWAERYRQSPLYQQYVVNRSEEARRLDSGASMRNAAAEVRRRPRSSPLQQFAILSARAWAVMRRDPRSLAVMLLQAPLMGLFTFVNYGKHIFTAASEGTATQPSALTSLFIMVIVVLLFGAVNAAREITKEGPVYRRERMINLRLAPYIFSKILVGGLLCLLQVGIYLGISCLSTDWPPFLGLPGWAQLYGTFVLVGLTGTMLGLVLSALASNDSQAVALIPVILIPQFIFAGVMMPDLASAPVIPDIATSKWAVAALANIARVKDLPLSDQGVAGRAARNETTAAWREQKTNEEVERVVRERLDGEVKTALEKTVAEETDRILAEKVASAQRQAEEEVRQRFAGNTAVTAQELELQLGMARQRATVQLFQARPLIEQEVRAKAEVSVRASVEVELRKRVQAEIAARSQPSDINLLAPDLPNPYQHIYGSNTYTDWGAMLGILVVLVGITLALQKRKDVV